jgi:uncharacterized delta-60 repeat protein
LPRALLVAGAALVVVAMTLAPAPAARAATAAGPGSLDPSFGDGGRVLVTTIPETSPAEFTAAAREPNGNLVFELRHRTVARTSALEIEMRTPTGAPVPTFGASGRLVLEDEDEGRSGGLTVLGNGDIAVGVRECGGRPSSIEMLDPTGARVAGFGNDGCAPAFDFDPSVVTTDPQGRLLVAGERNYCSPCGKDTIPGAEGAVGRLLPNGSLDLGFGTEGVVGTHATLRIEAGRSIGELEATTVGATADGGVLLAAGDELVRLDPNGALDTAYGKGGVVTTPNGIVAMLVEADGSVVVAAGSSLTRFTPTGSPDLGFGTEGTVSTSGEQIAPVPGGGYLLAGQESAPAGCDPCERAPFLARVTAAGQPDPTYGVGGVAAIHLAAPRLPWPAAPPRLLVNPDGSTIVVTSNYEQDAFAAAFTPTGAPDASFGEGGAVVEHFEQPAKLEPNGLALNADGSLTLVSARAAAPGLISGFRAEFDADGRQLPAPNGAAVVETLTHGAIAPLGGGAVAVLTHAGTYPRPAQVLESAGPDGLPSAGFGAAGIARLPPGFVTERISPAPAGGILAVGSFRPKEKKGTTMATYRLASNGQPLPGFGRQGLVTVHFAGAESKAFSGLIESDGDVVLTGAVGDSVGAARLLPNGRLDPRFGHAGRVRGLLAGGTSGTLVAPWHGGVVIATGRPRDAGGLVRLDARGHLVRDFGERGVVRQVPENPPLALFTGKGRIVSVTDPIFEKGHKGNGVELRAYRPDGTVERAFGKRGVRFFGSGRGRDRHTFVPAAAVQQPSGGVVVAGTALGGNLGTSWTSGAQAQAELVRFLVR